LREGHDQADLVSLIEPIAAEWDGCWFDAPGGAIDVGQALRNAAVRLQAGEAIASEAPRAESERRSQEPH
jgi:hypothetical protein